jgi:hypothetical protein
MEFSFLRQKAESQSNLIRKLYIICVYISRRKLQWRDCAMFKFQKGQGATEYLVLLAVVLIVAMVAIALLGFFPGLSYDAKKKESDSYWGGSASPFQIIEHAQTGTQLTIVLKNAQTTQLKINNITIAGGGSLFNVNAANLSQSGVASPNTPYIGAGETKTIYLTDANGVNCSAGTIYEYSVNISYDSTIANQKQYGGSKTIIGKCS